MRFNPLPPSMSTLVSRKPSTIGLRTKAAGARAVRNLGSLLALKVIAVSLHGFVVATWYTSARLRIICFRILFDAKVSKTVNTVLALLAGSPGLESLRHFWPPAVVSNMLEGCVLVLYPLYCEFCRVR